MVIWGMVIIVLPTLLELREVATERTNSVQQPSCSDASRVNVVTAVCFHLGKCQESDKLPGFFLGLYGNGRLRSS